MNNTAIKKDECEVCYKIVCRRCKWEPDEKQVQQISQGILTACPKCDWSPASD